MEEEQPESKREDEDDPDRARLAPVAAADQPGQESDTDGGAQTEGDQADLR